MEVPNFRIWVNGSFAFPDLVERAGRVLPRSVLSLERGRIKYGTFISEYQS